MVLPGRKGIHSCDGGWGIWKSSKKQNRIFLGVNYYATATVSASKNDGMDCQRNGDQAGHDWGRGGLAAPEITLT